MTDDLLMNARVSALEARISQLDDSKALCSRAEKVEAKVAEQVAYIRQLEKDYAAKCDEARRWQRMNNELENAVRRAHPELLPSVGESDFEKLRAWADENREAIKTSEEVIAERHEACPSEACSYCRGTGWVGDGTAYMPRERCHLWPKCTPQSKPRTNEAIQNVESQSQESTFRNKVIDRIARDHEGLIRDLGADFTSDEAKESSVDELTAEAERLGMYPRTDKPMVEDETVLRYGVMTENLDMLRRALGLREGKHSADSVARIAVERLVLAPRSETAIPQCFGCKTMLPTFVVLCEDCKTPETGSAGT